MITTLVGGVLLTTIAFIEALLKKHGNLKASVLLNVSTNIAMGATIALLLYKFIITITGIFL